MKKLLLVVFMLKLGVSFSQEDKINSVPYSSALAIKNNPTSQLNFSGFFRFLGFVRNQQETFPNNSGKTTAIVAGDFFREPMFYPTSLKLF